MGEQLDWAALALAVLVLAGYETLAWRRGRRDAASVARTLHAHMRARWLDAVSQVPGTEILAVQTLRNSLMSATISASTAALALMGGMSLAAPRLVGTAALAPTPRLLLELALLLALFASFVCSAMAMRYFNHAGFVAAMPVGSAARAEFLPLAERYLERAGLLYSWGLRLFLLAAPMLAGILVPAAALPAALLLLPVLRAFDRPLSGDGGRGFVPD